VGEPLKARGLPGLEIVSIPTNEYGVDTTFGANPPTGAGNGGSVSYVIVSLPAIEPGVGAMIGVKLKLYPAGAVSGIDVFTDVCDPPTGSSGRMACTEGPLPNVAPGIIVKVAVPPELVNAAVAEIPRGPDPAGGVLKIACGKEPVMPEGGFAIVTSPASGRLPKIPCGKEPVTPEGGMGSVTLAPISTGSSGRMACSDGPLANVAPGMIVKVAVPLGVTVTVVVGIGSSGRVAIPGPVVPASNVGAVGGTCEPVSVSLANGPNVASVGGTGTSNVMLAANSGPVTGAVGGIAPVRVTLAPVTLADRRKRDSRLSMAVRAAGTRAPRRIAFRFDMKFPTSDGAAPLGWTHGMYRLPRSLLPLYAENANEFRGPGTSSRE